jgi:para-aminobenzoate synthetase/4-amino-4-deoxychorismate lyase
MLRKTTFPCTPAPGSIVFDNINKRWLLFFEPYSSYSTNNYNEVEPIIKEIEVLSRAKKLFAAGFISYEAAPAFDKALTVKKLFSERAPFPLVSFVLFKKTEVSKTLYNTQNIFYENPLFRWQPSVTKQEYIQAVNKIKKLIKQGDTYQVNYTFRLKTDFGYQPLLFFLKHTQQLPPPYSSFFRTGDWAICSFSPELFFDCSAGRIISKPMKGTRRRGLSVREDLFLRKDLKESEKEKAENVMIVDMVRNDLAKIALKGSVKVSRLFETEQYPAVWQMTSTVEAKTHSSLYDILSALFPAASITGAPKPRTMKIISELETTPRKIYTGTMGWLSPEGTMRFNVAIRTALINTKEKAAEYGIGGGIVWDSTPESEFKECKDKASLLFTPQRSNFALLESIFYNGRTKKFRFLKEHTERMASSACYFVFLFDRKIFVRELFRFAGSLKQERYKIRVTLSRAGKISCSALPLQKSNKPVLLKLSKKPVDSSNTFLYHKTTNREIYEQAKEGIQGCEDVLLWNKKRELTESTIANIIYELKGENKKFTPPVSSGLLPGVARTVLLKKGKIEERVLRIEEVPFISRLWIVNSVRGIKRAMLLNKPDNHLF